MGEPSFESLVLQAMQEQRNSALNQLASTQALWAKTQMQLKQLTEEVSSLKAASAPTPTLTVVGEPA